MPSPYLVLDRIAHATPDGRQLFRNLSLSIGAERVAVVGVNGAGKSTLLHIAAGEAFADGGTVRRCPSVFLFRQSPATPPTARVADELGLGNHHRDRMAEVFAVLAQMGVGHLGPDRSLGTLSGGELTRVRLAAAILARPDLLLLDEPTNDLDAEGRRIVHRLVAGWRKGLIVASHDRALLRWADRIVEISELGVAFHRGDYNSFIARKNAERENAGRDLERAKRKAESLARNLADQRQCKARRDAKAKRGRSDDNQSKILLDFRKGRAEGTKSRMVRDAERLTTQAARELASASERVERYRTTLPRIEPSGLPAGRIMVELRDVVHPALPEPLDLSIAGRERVRVAGTNGAGKSTLLKIMAGRERPLSGTVHLAEARVGSMDQHSFDLAPHRSILENYLSRHPDASRNDAHTALARFLFRNSDVHLPVERLSGGQRFRAALACALGGAGSPQILFLDEPTNHLDLDGVAGLETVLRDFDGTLVLVSHDEDFVDAVGIGRTIRLTGTRFSG